jgi:hypothetical protein
VFPVTLGAALDEAAYGASTAVRCRLAPSRIFSWRNGFWESVPMLWDVEFWG